MLLNKTTQVSKPNPAGVDETHQYCCGLPLTQLRTLAPSELAVIQMQVRKHEWAIARTVILYPAIFILLYIVLLRYRNQLPQSDMVDIAIVIIFGFFGLLLGIPMVILRTKDLINRRKAYKATLSKKFVRRFEGKVLQERADGIEKIWKVKIDDPNQPFVIESLMGADAIYSIQDKPVSKWNELYITYASTKQPNTPYFQIPKDHFLDGKVEDYPVYLARRRMTQGEIDEILFYARRVKRKYWGSIYVFMFTGGLTMTVLPHLSVTAQTTTHAAISIASTLTLMYLYKIWSTSRSFRRDAEYSWSIQYDPDKNPDDHEGNRIIEYLPDSNAIWLVENVPADWRSKGVSRELFF